MSNLGSSARVPVLVYSVGVVAVVSTGAILVGIGNVSRGVWWLSIGFGGAVFSSRFLARGRRLSLATGGNPPEGSAADSKISDVSAADGGSTWKLIRRWVGAGTMPGSLGYLQATWPLSVLELSSEGISLRLRPRLFAKITGTEPLKVGFSNAVIILPVRSQRTWQGIEFRVQGQQSYYFWTKRRSEIFASFVRAGCEVSDDDESKPPAPPTR
jgi:hypothetical protein